MPAYTCLYTHTHICMYLCACALEIVLKALFCVQNSVCPGSGENYGRIKFLCGRWEKQTIMQSTANRTWIYPSPFNSVLKHQFFSKLFFKANTRQREDRSRSVLLQIQKLFHASPSQSQHIQCFLNKAIFDSSCVKHSLQDRSAPKNADKGVIKVFFQNKYLV